MHALQLQLQVYSPYLGQRSSQMEGVKMLNLRTGHRREVSECRKGGCEGRLERKYEVGVKAQLSNCNNNEESMVFRHCST